MVKMYCLIKCDIRLRVVKLSGIFLLFIAETEALDIYSSAILDLYTNVVFV